MRTIVVSTVASIVMVLWVSTDPGLVQQLPPPGITGLRLELWVGKREILLGQPLNISFVLTNTGNRPVKLSGAVGPGIGNMTLWVAFDNGTYKRYSGPGWGMIDSISQPWEMKSGERIVREESVLYHRARSVEGEIDTYWAFPKAGSYLLKGAFWDLGQEIKSEPIPVLVKEPQGVDAEVWKVMKDNPEYAYFIQTLGPTTWERTKRMTETMEQLLEKYPTTSYAPYLRAAVEGFYRGELETKRIRRKEVEETLRQAGQHMQAGRQDYGRAMLRDSKVAFLLAGLFPKNLPLDAYVGLAYMMVKEYEKAREYLDKVTPGLEPTRENRVVLEAAAFVRLALGEQEQAVQTLARTRTGKERDTLFSRFREQLRRGLAFSFEPYEDEVNTSDYIK